MKAMNRIQKFNTVAIIAFVSLLSSCSEVPFTGRKQLNLVPDSIMNSMSFQSYSEFISQNKPSTNAEQTQMVKRVGQRISQAVEKYSAQEKMSLKGYSWEFNLIEDPSVNAWAMSGGKVVVYTGLLPVVQDEAGLAVVMGHEIAHAIAKHGSERMSQGLIVQMGGMALSKALETKPAQTRDLFMKSYGIGTEVGVTLPFSRTHETEADRLGLIFMAMAGYNPNVAVEFWQRMAAAKKGATTIELLSTHPADETRIRNIKTFIPQAMRYYDQGR
jgi:predicted Zn-dependent protease